MPEPPNRAKGYSRNYPLPGAPMSEVDPRISGLCGCRMGRSNGVGKRGGK